jgi:hypothetical protein
MRLSLTTRVADLVGNDQKVFFAAIGNNQKCENQWQLLKWVVDSSMLDFIESKLGAGMRSFRIGSTLFENSLNIGGAR